MRCLHALTLGRHDKSGVEEGLVDMILNYQMSILVQTQSGVQLRHHDVAIFFCVVVKIFVTYLSLVISRIGEASFAIARERFSWCTWENFFLAREHFSLSLIDNAKVRFFFVTTK